jgi:putative two-component system response regulator
VESDLPTPLDSPIFVVEDDVALMNSLTRMLERMGYPVKGFADPLAARRALDAGEEVHLLVTDQVMPGMDGVTLIQHALEVDPNTAAVMITGIDHVETAIEALRLGVVDYLLKPVDVTQLGLAVQRGLMARAQNEFRRERVSDLRTDAEIRRAEIELQTRELESISVATFTAFVKLLEARSPHFRNHSQAVARLSETMAASLALPAEEVEAVRVGGLLHDIGMVAVPDGIIDKGEELTAAEIARVRAHPRIAEEVLRPLPHLGAAVDYVLFHHERLNGSGYPEGRTAKNIPLGAQIVGLADAFIALTESRAFRDAVAPDDALGILRGAEGQWFAGPLLDVLEESAPLAQADPSF